MLHESWCLLLALDIFKFVPTSAAMAKFSINDLLQAMRKPFKVGQGSISNNRRLVLLQASKYSGVPGHPEFDPKHAASCPKEAFLSHSSCLHLKRISFNIFLQRMTSAKIKVLVAEKPKTCFCSDL